MEGLTWNVDTIAHVIDISVAPVFLLAGISGLLMVLTNRLGRTIDRSRSLQAVSSRQILDQQRVTIDQELKALLVRSRYINRAINLATLSALMVCVVIIALFVGSLANVNVAFVVASLFIVCMLLLAMAFYCFLVEVFIATRRLQTTLVSAESYRSIEHKEPE